MPRRDLDEHFEEERPEWTRRKHDLLSRYVKPAAMKMRLRGGSIALVDGYAVVNAYGEEATGSTAIMLDAARGVRAQGSQATVYACESDKRRFDQMTSNLANDTASGTLQVFHQTHANALPKILAAIAGIPAIVFLDPQTVTQMTLADDVLPWVARPSTDVLGIFMAGQACRIVGQVLKTDARPHVSPESYLGSNWQQGDTLDGAWETFFGALGDDKRFKAMYHLRKMEPMRYAYGIFGMSDHPDGFWLLSSAVAKDSSVLKDFDYRKSSPSNLFAESEREEDQRQQFDRLVELAGPTIKKFPSLRGGELASQLFAEGVGIQELFGRFEAADFTSAAYFVLNLPDRRPSAKAKRD